MKNIIKITIIALICFTPACSDGTKASFSALGKKHRVKLYSGGVVVGEWVSSGKITNETNSDGYYFNDDATDKLVRVDNSSLKI